MQTAPIQHDSFVPLGVEIHEEFLQGPVHAPNLVLLNFRNPEDLRKRARHSTLPTRDENAAGNDKLLRLVPERSGIFDQFEQVPGRVSNIFGNIEAVAHFTDFLVCC